MKRFLISSVLTICMIGAAAAQEAALAEVGLQKRIDALSQDAAAHGFELGMLSALRGVERSLQTRFEYGLGDQLMALPMLRMELGARNPRAREFTPETLSQMMRDVLADMQTARGYLQSATRVAEITPFVLTLQDVWFDVNSNGRREAGEDALEALGPLLLGRNMLRDMRESDVLAQPLSVRFDSADHAWLTAYTHMLSGFGALFLAFDPAPVLQDLGDKRAALAAAPEIPNIFDPEALAAEIDTLEQAQVALDASLSELRARERSLKDQLDALRAEEPRDGVAIARISAQINRLRAGEIRPLRAQQRSIRAEIAAANAKLTSGGRGQFDQFRNDVDAIYVLLAALRQQPDAALISQTRAHWLAMIAQNKVFWAALAAETDNDREWIPNPAQSSALPVRVDANMARGWQAILQDAEDLLEGRLLLPHPLLPGDMGISLKAYAENPGSLDVIDWFQGIGAYPYAAKGPLITRQRWLAFQRLTGGNAAGFALFFN